MTAAAPGARWLVNRAYARLWWGQSVSALGDGMFTVTAALWAGTVIAAGRPWAPAAVSGLAAAAAIAVTVTGPAAGLLADRYDRRTVLAGTEVVRAVAAAALAGLSFIPAGALPAWGWLAALYAAVLVLNGAGQVFVPAQIAMTSVIVPGGKDRVRAAALAEAAGSAAGIFGPLAAAPLMLAAGVHAALIINAATYLVSLASALSLPRSPGSRPGGGLRQEFAAGLRAFTASSLLPALTIVTAICQLGTGTVTALNFFAVTRDLHGPPGAYAIAEAVMGAGYLGGAVAAGRLAGRFGARDLISGGLLAAGILAAVYAVQHDLAAGLAVLACYAAMIGLLNTAAAPMLMSAVPQEYLGRAMAVFRPAGQAAAAVSALGSGWAATAMRGLRAPGGNGAITVILLVGAALIITAGIRAALTLPRRAPAASTGQAPRPPGARR